MNKVTPKDFFLWVGALVALYGSIISFITLLFEYINYTFPDPLEYGYSYVDPYSGTLRFSMAALIVLVPVVLVLMRLIRKDIEAMPEKQDIWVRRWALYLTLFIGGAVVVGDLITLVNTFLGGELTTRFALKVVVVLLVAGAAFLHFLADLRGYWTQNPQKARTIGWAVGVLVLLTIVSGFFIIGSPNAMRMYRFDAEKVRHLGDIQWQVVNYWQQKERLPGSLDQLRDQLTGWNAPVDPQTKESYTYRKTGDLTFELCATFNAESLLTNSAGTPIMEPSSVYGTGNENWNHTAGENCFKRTIDPDRYPPYTKGR